MVPPTITFADSLAIDLGGVTVELSHLPGHTEDCLVAFVPEWGVLLAGDTVETPFPLLDETLPVQPWIDRLAEWAGRADVETVIPCHGEIGGRELIEGNIAYFADYSMVLPGRRAAMMAVSIRRATLKTYVKRRLR